MKTNQVTLIGYVGKHLHSSKITDDSKRVAIRMATHYYKKSTNGDYTRDKDWHDVLAWDHHAAFAEQQLVKGSHIMVEGCIVYRTYLDNTGHKRFITQIKVQELLNLDR